MVAGQTIQEAVNREYKKYSKSIAHSVFELRDTCYQSSRKMLSNHFTIYT